MSLAARMKSAIGSNYGPVKSVAAAATLEVPLDANVFETTGTETVTSLDPITVMPGRKITIESASGTLTLTNTNDATAYGTMELGGSNVALAAGDIITLTQGDAGQWKETSISDNSP